MNRGSALAAPSRSAATRAFNEAPIHESGKCRLGLGRHRRPKPFNEAPIHESGK